MKFAFPGLCTHIIYSFAGLDTATSKIKSLDPWLDLGDGGSTGRRTFLLTTELKRRNPELKVSLAIGGWNEGSEKYSKMAADPAKRAIFVKSVLKMLRDYNFDGFDLDWEYPGMTNAERLIKVKGNACFLFLLLIFIANNCKYFAKIFDKDGLLGMFRGHLGVLLQILIQ